MGKFTCPYCYAEHDINDCGLKCSYTVIGNPDKKCKFYETKDIKYNDSFGTDWIITAKKKKCIKCKEAAIQLFCDDLKKEIPVEFLDMKGLPIALLGAKASGKSNYIGVLVNEIRKKMAGAFNCSLSVTCSIESKQAYQENYYRPLFEEGFVVRATDKGETPPPLIFPLRFMNEKNKIVNMTALTFYDTAGENLDDKSEMHTFNRYISNAKGIILLLDPLQVPNIRNMLTANGFTGLPAQNTEIYEVLSTIIDVIRNEKKIKGEINIPLALVFTKIDVLEKYNVLPQTSCFRKESEHISRGVFVLEDFDNTNIEMKDLIDNWLDAELKQSVKQFKQHSFFGVTALGANPAGGTKIEAAIKPRRVLDPLLWLLAEHKYIKSVKV